jgi:hypothetical protein
MRECPRRTVGGQRAEQWWEYLQQAGTPLISFKTFIVVVVAVTREIAVADMSHLAANPPPTLNRPISAAGRTVHARGGAFGLCHRRNARRLIAGRQ